MPNMDGLTATQEIRLYEQQQSQQPTPIIALTASILTEGRTAALQAGMTGFCTKFVSNLLPKQEVIRVMGFSDRIEASTENLHEQPAGHINTQIGLHVKRMSQYSRVLALAYGLDAESANEVLAAAPMHDIGKIAIPDSILLKPGKLTDEEFGQMKEHVVIGAEILSKPYSRLIQLASSVALHHHEKSDATGYPQGLSGEDIPIEARIEAVVDVFDALTSVRPYKKAWTVEETMALFRE